MAYVMELTHFLLEDEVLLSGVTVLTGAVVGFSVRLVRTLRQRTTI